MCCHCVAKRPRHPGLMLETTHVTSDNISHQRAKLPIANCMTLQFVNSRSSVQARLAAPAFQMRYAAPRLHTASSFLCHFFALREQLSPKPVQDRAQASLRAVWHSVAAVVSGPRTVIRIRDYPGIRTPPPCRACDRGTERCCANTLSAGCHRTSS